MMLNRVKPNGNMYDWITESWNPIGGKCPHSCKYCYAQCFRWPALKAKYSGPPRMIESELKRNLGKDKFWFVGSCFDIFALPILDSAIVEILDHCKKYDNKYLFQTKNPSKMITHIKNFPVKSILGVTIETDWMNEFMGKTPSPTYRAMYMQQLADLGFETMVTIEPIMRFTSKLVEHVKHCRPRFVNIGADSGGHNLPEPPKENVLELIAELSKFTEVKPKKNLKRILGREWSELPK